MAKSVSEKCITCNAPLKYDAKKDVFKCDYCGNTYTIDDLNKYKQTHSKKTSSKPKTMDVSVYNCENCGAIIILGDNTSSTSCVYCKSTALIKERLEGLYAPSKIITFQFTKDDAINKFKELCQGRRLMPDNFDDIRNIQDMEGLYVPFWLYDCENSVQMGATCTKSTTWTDSRYINTKTDFYNVDGNGVLIFDKIPNDAASRFDDKIMNAIEPFDYSKFKEFNKSYLSGYLSEKYDVEMQEAYKNVQQRLNNDSQSYLINKINGYDTKTINRYVGNINIKEHDYVLLPVWVLNIKYNDKIYRFSMNGQTGKFVGEIPVDNKKLFKLIGITFAISFIIVLAVLLVIGGV